MQNGEENIQILMDLGLNSSQAKVYLTLLTLGKANGKTIHEHSGVARQHLYEILADLQKKGLIEKIVATPTQFRATPIQTGLSTLLEHKIKECKETEKKTKKLLQGFSFNREQTPEKEGEFVISHAHSSNTKNVDPGEDVDKTMDCLTTTRRWEKIQLDFPEQLKKLLRRDVKLRLITEKPNNRKRFLQNLQPLLRSKNVQVRYLTNFPVASMSVFDHRRIVVDLNPFSEPAKTPRLQTDHQSFIGVFQEYFEEIWNQAQEYELLKQKAPRTAKQTQKTSETNTS